MKSKIYLSILISLLGIGLLSCVRKNTVRSSPPPSQVEVTPPARSGMTPETSNRRGADGYRENAIVYVPTPKVGKKEKTSGRSEGQKPTTSPVPEGKQKKEGIKINVEGMPLNEFINLVFSKTLKRSYYIDKRIEKKNIPVTLKMEAPIPPDRFMTMVAEILKRCGVRMEKRDGVLFLTPRIWRGPQQEKEIPPFFIGKHVPEEVAPQGYIGLIYPLYYIDARQYAALIKTMALTSRGKAMYIPRTNAMLLTDEARAVESAANLLRLFDRPAFENQTAVLIYLDYIPAKDFQKRLTEVLQAQGIPVVSRRGERGIAVIPLPELNSVFVVSPKKEWIDLVRYWKEKLDDPAVLGDQPQLFVYYPKNRRAKDLEKVASKFEAYGGVTVHLKGKIGGSRVNVKRRGRATRPAEPVRKNAESKVKIVVDEGRNALVILATPTQYKEIKKILDELDVLPKEVMIKVTIAEVTLSDQLQYGVEWYLRHSTTHFAHEVQTLGGLGLGNQGLFYSVIQETKKFQAAINAFAEKKLIKILSSPHLVVLDNKEASINVGTDVPIVTSESSASDINGGEKPSVLRNIEYRNTGVILHIKPTINSGGILTLDVHQEVSEAQTNNISPDISSPLILTRDIKTSVVLKSGMTLLLGGLIKNNKSNTRDQVPLLGDIPILGNLFKVTSNSTDRTELIVEITPYIIGSVQQAEDVTNKFRSLIKWYKKK